VETHVVGAKDDVLHHHGCVALELGIRRQAGRVHLQCLFPMNLNAGFLAALLASFGFAPLLLRRIIRPHRLCLAGLDVGLALFPFQPIVFIPQTLIICLCIPQVGAQVFNQVQQPFNQLTGVLVFYAAQVYRFQHSGVSLPAYRQNGKGSTCRAFPPVY